MLKQTKIQLDRNEIQSIKQKCIQQWSQSHGDQTTQNVVERVEYELVKGEIFPKEFVPFCVDQYSRESSLKLYKIKQNSYDMQLLSARITILQETVNSFKQGLQRLKLVQLFRLDEVSNFITYLNEISELSQQNQYLSYFQQGLPLEKVDLWRLKHSQQNPKIPYQQRQSLLKDYQLILRLIGQLTKSKEFSHLNLSIDSMLMHQYEKCNEFKSQYGIRIKCNWVFDMLVQNQHMKVGDSNLLQNSRKILSKILGISEDKSARSQLDQHHYEKIQHLTSLHDMIKLNYHDFYFVKSNKPENSSKGWSSQSNKQELQKLKNQILYFEDLAKNELKSLKLENLQPKIKETTKQTNKIFWASIQKYILNNLTQSQRKSIITLGQNKNNTQTNVAKKPEKKPSTSSMKKTQLKDSTKIEKKEQAPEVNTKNLTLKQVVVEAIFLASASDIKFRPQRLIQLIQDKESLLYILKTKNKESGQQPIIACYINCKPQKQNLNFLGSYSPDVSRKSFIYSSKTDKFYSLLDKNYAVGYGPEIFFSIGKLDIIVPCFGTEIIDVKQWMKCISYFPVSYSEKGLDINEIEKFEDQKNKQLSHNNKNDELGIGREFLLEDVDIYEIKLKAQ